MSGKSRIQRIMEDAVSGSVFPGAVLLVCRSKANLLFEAVGNAALLPSPRPMARGTLFDLASLTKPLATALAVLSLVSMGRLDLDAPLAELLGSQPVPADKAGITPRQLLCHCSGLPAWRPYYLYLEGLPRFRRQSHLRRQLFLEPLEAAPGRSTLYSDLGFLLLQWIVEESSGESLDQFARQRLFLPLGCKTLGYRVLDKLPEDSPDDFAATEHCPWRGLVMNGRVHDENAYALGGVAGHAGLFGTALDIKVVLEAILDSFAARATAAPWSVEDLARFLRPAHLDPTSTWALGFDTPAPWGSSAGSLFSPETVGHLGYTGTSFWLDLRRQMAVILLSNRIHPSRNNEKIKDFRPRLHDAVLEEFG